MADHRRLILLITLALAVMACQITINMPSMEVKTGPTMEQAIEVPAPEGEASLQIGFGAGDLTLHPGENSLLVKGEARYNIGELKPVIQRDGEKITLQSGEFRLDGFPRFTDSLVNQWDLALGEQPMSLEIKAGAYRGTYELGSLALKAVDVAEGGANTRLTFSEPNRVEMDTLRYLTGASNVTLAGLGNANFQTMIFRSGAGNFQLDFSGDWRRDATVILESGFSTVTIIVPRNVSARVISSGVMLNIELGDGWKKVGEDYILPGSEPKLNITVDMAAGVLRLYSSD